MIAVELADVLGVELPMGSVHEVHDAMVRSVPEFAPVSRDALRNSPDGILAAESRESRDEIAARTPNERAGFAYRLVVSRKLYDGGRNVEKSPSLAGLAPGAALHLHPLDLDRLGAPEGAQVKVIGDRTSIVMKVVSDASVQRNTAWVPWNQLGANVGELIDATRPVNDVRVETL
jgi:NADH-quinone oxidoreductase subunit G